VKAPASLCFRHRVFYLPVILKILKNSFPDILQFNQTKYIYNNNALYLLKGITPVGNILKDNLKWK